MHRFILSCVWAMLLAVASAAAVAGKPTVASDKPAAPQSRNPIDRWNQMSPEERERELAKLPPERARQIRERIRRYNQLPPREKQALREGYQKFAQLSPERQEVVRQRMRDFRQLPQSRRQLVRREIGQLRALPEPQRGARMNSEEFRSQFSPRERQIVRDITEYLPGQP
jgi:Protein of unknown function (DUF3106)